MPTKVHLVKAMVFPAVMYGCDRWTINKVEHQRTDAFELWCWRRLLRVPWTARRSNQSVLKEINLEYSLKGLVLKQKIQYLATWCKHPTHWKRLWCWERLRVGGEEGNGGWDGWMASLIQWTWVWANSRRWWRTGKPGLLQFMGLKRIKHELATEQHQSWVRGIHELFLQLFSKIKINSREYFFNESQEKDARFTKRTEFRD